MTNAFTHYLGYYTDKKKQLIMSGVLTVVQTLALVPIARIIQHIFDTTVPEKNIQQLIILLSSMALLFLLNSLALLWNRHITFTIIKDVVYQLRKDILEQSLYFDRQFFLREDLDIVHSKIVQDTERIDYLTSAFLTQFLPTVGITIGLSCVLLWINPFLFLIVSSIFIIIFGIGRLTRRRITKEIDLMHQHFSLFSKKVSFTLKFNELIKLSTAEKVELEEQHKTIGDLRQSSHSLAWITTIHVVLQGNMLMLAGIAVLLVGGFQVISGSATVGSILSFYIALSLLSANLKGLIGTIPTILEGIRSLETIMSLRKNNPTPITNTTPFQGFTQNITFSDVSFAHANFALPTINLTIPKNQSIGIFGASGSGKSTLISLLLGFFKPTHGEISLDGTNIQTIDLIDYRRRIGVLSQDPLIFPGTIRENLTYGLENISDAEIISACTTTDIHTFIDSLTEKYDSIIGERGVTISGGQKQRIALARALLRKPAILILDEPDNNLDDATIIAILKRLQTLQLTIIVISHNTALIPHLDRIYQFDSTTKHFHESTTH